MRADGGGHDRQQGSLTTRAQTASVVRDGENGTGGGVDMEEHAWRRVPTVGQASKEARHARRPTGALDRAPAGAYL